MNKLPPIEKIYEAYTAVIDNRVITCDGSAKVSSSDGLKVYDVAWSGNTWSSTDNATYWQGYPGYPVIAVWILQGILSVDKGVIVLFSGVAWNTLNKKHKRDYRAALLEVFSDRAFSEEQIERIEKATRDVYRQIQALDIRIVRKAKNRGGERNG